MSVTKKYDVILKEMDAIGPTFSNSIEAMGKLLEQMKKESEQGNIKLAGYILKDIDKSLNHLKFSLNLVEEVRIWLASKVSE